MSDLDPYLAETERQVNRVWQAVDLRAVALANAVALAMHLPRPHVETGCPHVHAGQECDCPPLSIEEHDRVCRAIEHVTVDKVLRLAGVFVTWIDSGDDPRDCMYPIEPENFP